MKPLIVTLPIAEAEFPLGYRSVNIINAHLNGADAVEWANLHIRKPCRIEALKKETPRRLQELVAFGQLSQSKSDVWSVDQAAGKNDCIKSFTDSEIFYVRANSEGLGRHASEHFRRVVHGRHPVTMSEKLAGNPPDTASQFYYGSRLGKASLKYLHLATIRKAQIEIDGTAVSSFWPSADTEVVHRGGHISLVYSMLPSDRVE